MSPITKKRKIGERNESKAPDTKGQQQTSDVAELGVEELKKATPSELDPVEVSSLPDKSFADLGIIPELCEACEALGFKKPTPIQAQAIPIALEGRDVIGVAETGSGKTCAFALPILQALMKEPQSKVFGLVLAPTRELAMQISQQIEALGSIIQVKCATIVGGLPMIPQAVALAQKPHIIVATPGRLVDHLESTKGFHLNTLKYLVLDEADRLLDLDFGDAINKILQTISHKESERRTYLFSATMSKKVGGLQRASLKDPVRVSVSNTSHQTVAQLVQEWLLVPAHQKDLYLTYLLSVKYPGLTVIVFARTINKTQELAYLLRRLGMEAIPIHGELAQSHRLAALNKFRAGSRNILVATDVAARGLDIPSVGIVINYDLPDDCTTYVHRVGRTARAGKSGKAISLVTQYDAELWMRIEHARGSKVPMMENLDKSDVMALATSVDEAQVEAKRELRDAVEKGKKRGGIGMGKTTGRGGARGGARGNIRGRRGRDDQDRGER